MKNKKLTIAYIVRSRKRMIAKSQEVFSTIKAWFAAILMIFFYNIASAATWCTTVFCWWADWLKAVKESLPDNIIKSESLVEVVMWYTSFFLPYAGLFAFLALVYSGFLYVTSPINEEWAKKAKDILRYVVIWIILIFLSYSIVALFINIW